MIIQCILQGEKAKEAWKAFFLLPRLILALPRGGSLISRQVHNYLKYFRAGEWEALLTRKFHHMGERTIGRDRNRRAESLARAGYMSGAVRALGNCAIEDTSKPEVYNKLRE